MATVNDILAFLNERAPISTKLEWDNVGLLAGFSGREVKKILVALDITDDVVEEAAGKNTDLIVSHHPLFFELKRAADDDPQGRKVVKLIQNCISAICMHTNLDAAAGGVNDTLAGLLGLENTEILTVGGILPDGKPYGIGRYGELRVQKTMSEFLPFVKQVLKANGLRYHDSGRPVKRVAVVGGSGGGDMMRAIKMGCDTFVTSDIKYNSFLDAKEHGLNLIDADHFCTENVACRPVAEWIKGKFENINVEISETHAQTTRFF